MRSAIRIAKPDDVEVSLTITMPLADWRRLREQLQAPAFPSWRMGQVIDDAVERVTRNIVGEADEAAP